MALGKGHAVLEVCVDSVASAVNAWHGGAGRLELCSSLSLGGLTPSVGLFKVVKKLISSECPVFVMIRPKEGESFQYDELELEIMEEDIKCFRAIGADGFVFGCLKKDKLVDERSCEKLIRAARGLPCTFHRAFDVAARPETSLRTIARLGFSRILTSGQEKTAHAGRSAIKGLVAFAKECEPRLVIVAGGGLDERNLAETLETTGVQEFHGSARDRSSEEAKTSERVVREMVRVSRQIQSCPPEPTPLLCP